MQHVIQEYCSQQIISHVKGVFDTQLALRYISVLEHMSACCTICHVSDSRLLNSKSCQVTTSTLQSSKSA